MKNTEVLDNSEQLVRPIVRQQNPLYKYGKTVLKWSGFDWLILTNLGVKNLLCSKMKLHQDLAVKLNTESVNVSIIHFTFSNGEQDPFPKLVRLIPAMLGKRDPNREISEQFDIIFKLTTFCLK